MTDEITATEYDALYGGQVPAQFHEFAKFVVEDKKIPKNVKDRWWGFLNKDTILTRSDHKNDGWAADNDFAIRKNIHLMSQPAYKNNISELVTLDNVRRRFLTQHRRSLDGFERQALTTQIKELRTNRPAESGQTGIFAGLKKKLGLGPKEVPYAGG